jgi:GntR family transcriptional regulator, transcriptional repressor for pyruvate dehydrogenase complex
MKKFEETLRFFAKVEVGKASDIIVNQIMKMLDDGSLKPGARLPPERIMAEQFGVGRSHVREAITKLASLGILRTLPQSGTYVREVTREKRSQVLKDIIERGRSDSEDLIDLWFLLLQSGFTMSLEKSDTSDCEDLAARMASRAARGKYSFADELSMHACLAAMHENGVVRELLEYLNPIAHRILEETVPLTPESQQGLCDCWRELAESLKQRNAERAREAVRRHVQVLTALWATALALQIT